MAVEALKSPLQPASNGAGGCFGYGSASVQSGGCHAENCNPNMGKEAVTPGKCAPKKAPGKPKSTILCDNDVGKSPVRRRLDCDAGALEGGVLGKSPAKVAMLREVGNSPHKHFCRSPRCAANNPDYAVPAPRQYLKSKRHLIPGWQPPQNSKLKALASSVPVEDNSYDHHTICNEAVEENNGEDVFSKTVVETAPDGIEGELTRVSDTEACLVPVVKHSTPRKIHVVEPPIQWVGADVEDPATDVEGRVGPEDVVEVLQPQSVLSNSTREGSVNNAVEDVNLESRDCNEGALSTSTTSTRPRTGDDVTLDATSRGIPVIMEDSVRASRNTVSSGFSFRSKGDGRSYSRRDKFGSSRPLRRKYYKMGGRRLSVGTSSNQSILLNKQEGLKRKQAEEWMWDSAIKDAVMRLVPKVPGTVNALVKAFETVKLTEEEIQRAKYKNSHVGRLAQKDSQFSGGCGAPESSSVDVSQLETIASINKVHAWDESMASAELVDNMNSLHPEQDEKDLPKTPKRVESRIAPYTSKSAPPKVRTQLWAISGEQSTTSKDDTCSDKGASTSSGKTRTTAWTCTRKGQAMRLQKLKRCTSLHPFRLRTEERGAMKEYEFSKRLQHMWQEEERLRIPLAQGLPWTTEEPAIPPKPPVKEQTKPEAFRLITDIRAVERAEFDDCVAERQRQEEMMRQEEEMRRKVAEEEEVRRLRREMVPRAQLMPYFDRPFMPRRSSKKLTVPREPKFLLKQHKRPRCMAGCSSIAA